jgi:ribonuclease BN (tRNA processing enzyme)
MKLCKWFAYGLAGLIHLPLAVQGEPACHSLQPSSAGGPLPRNPDVLVLRYFSYGNYELAYRGKVLLLDAFYDNSRSPIAASTGLNEADITKANEIFIGHTHFDHYQDAPAVAKRTGATVYLGPPGLEYVRSQGLPESQIKVVRGGETIKLSGYTVQTALGIHMATDPKKAAACQDLIAKTSTATEEQKKAHDVWRRRR